MIRKGRAEVRAPRCVISAACLRARGLPAHCRQLRVLEVFRDYYVAPLPEGPEVLAEYDERAPKIVDAIEALGPERARAVWLELYSVVADTIRLIEGRNDEEAYELFYAETFMELEARYLTSVSPTVQTTVPSTVPDRQRTTPAATGPGNQSSLAAARTRTLAPGQAYREEIPT